jgi:aspartate/methionine/tyrosine aminotransferase
MFSSRIGWNLTPNRLFERVQSLRRSGADILDLTESNPTKVGLSYPASEILAPFNDSALLAYDPLPAGMPSARRAVSGYYSSRGYRVGAERIFLTASTSESYGWIFKLLADPGDELLAPRPSYPLLEYLSGLESIRTVGYPLDERDGWSIDFEILSRAISPRTRAVVVVNPNNPTGSFIKKEELRQLKAICRERDLAIISDEVFSDYALSTDPARVDSLVNHEDALTFTLSGLSKVSALPQMKLGWIVIGGPRDHFATAAERLELIADTYLPASGPVQNAAGRLLALGARMQEQILDRVRANRSVLDAAMAPLAGCRSLTPEAGWYGIIELPGSRGEEDWALLLLEADGLLVQPGYLYDFQREGFLVVSLLIPTELFEDGIGRLARRLAGGGPA